MFYDSLLFRLELYEKTESKRTRFFDVFWNFVREISSALSARKSDFSFSLLAEASGISL